MTTLPFSSWTQTDRRDLLKMCAAAVAAGLVPGGVAATGAAMALPTGQRALIAAVADTILPDTDTPGAVKAGVVEFIVLMLESWFDPADRDRFLAGLDALEARARGTSGRSFTALPAAWRLKLLITVQAETTAARHRGASVPFFLMMKRLTVFGYYTSEVGASQELTLNLVPGEYQPCAHLDHSQHAFSMGRGSPIFPVFDDPVSY